MTLTVGRDRKFIEVSPHWSEWFKVRNSRSEVNGKIHSGLKCLCVIGGYDSIGTIVSRCEYKFKTTIDARVSITHMCTKYLQENGRSRPQLRTVIIMQYDRSKWILNQIPKILGHECIYISNDEEWWWLSVCLFVTISLCRPTL